MRTSELRANFDALVARGIKLETEHAEMDRALTWREQAVEMAPEEELVLEWQSTGRINESLGKDLWSTSHWLPVPPMVKSVSVATHALEPMAKGAPLGATLSPIH